MRHHPLGHRVTLSAKRAGGPQCCLFSELRTGNSAWGTAGAKGCWYHFWLFSRLPGTFQVSRVHTRAKPITAEPTEELWGGRGGVTGEGEDWEGEGQREGRTAILGRGHSIPEFRGSSQEAPRLHGVENPECQPCPLDTACDTSPWVCGDHALPAKWPVCLFGFGFGDKVSPTTPRLTSNSAILLLCLLHRGSQVCLVPYSSSGHSSSLQYLLQSESDAQGSSL